MCIPYGRRAVPRAALLIAPPGLTIEADIDRRRTLDRWENLPRSPPLEDTTPGRSRQPFGAPWPAESGRGQGGAVKLADAAQKLGCVFDPDRWMGGQPPPGPPDGGPLPTRVALLEHEQHDRQRVLGVDSSTSSLPPRPQRDRGDRWPRPGRRWGTGPSNACRRRPPCAASAAR